MMEAYTSLAQYYDSLTQDVPYCAFADYYEKLFKLYGLEVNSILDLACGTGTLTSILSRRGYDMIGADGSADMLAEAMSKSYELERRPLYLCQTMEELDLYGTVDAVVCSLDGINYVEPEALPRVFHRVHLFTEPDGVFIFDINSPSKLNALDGQMFVDETDDVFCVWRASLEDKECLYAMDIFSKQGRLWSRTTEEHVEYVYTPQELKELLEEEGFIDVRIYGELSTEPPKEEEQRIFITARKRIDG